MLADFPLSIDYAQVLVFTASHPRPGLLWTDDHVAQGFAWSEGVVSFGVPDHDGECRLQVELADAAAIEPDAISAVQVPFTIGETIKLGSVFELREAELPHGRYALAFQIVPGDAEFAYVLRLSFVPDEAADFAILKPGGDVTATTVLRRGAELA